MKKVPLSDFDYTTNIYDDGVNIWSAVKLHKAAEGLESFDVPLASIDLSKRPWGNINLCSLIHHMKRINESDLRYPIIFDDEGTLADGYHRVCKAIMNGKETIRAVRLLKMPDPDRASET